MSKDVFEKELKAKITLIDQALHGYLAGGCPHSLKEAISYSLFSEGKRLRPVIVLAVCEAFGGDVKKALPFACAIELIHTYSLVHDDLPAMDDDDFRRGKPSNHKAFGEGMAILAGDGMLNLAYEIMLEVCCDSMDKGQIAAAKRVAKACGIFGMVGGQALDIADTPKNHEDIFEIYNKKTAFLFREAFVAGGLCSSDLDDLFLLEKIGLNFGIAFQMKDDIDDKDANVSKIGGDKYKKIFEETKSELYKDLNSLKNAAFLLQLIDEVF
ncbi:MAG: polyprenyl synthetase family protein [Defluviitaleaceae bacterium]|nr:polyprenyl synthetase family protein [Defluviitaleaceae bacterium]